MKYALITGITGQDGSYLAEILLDKGYNVYGIIRRHSQINTQRIDHIFSRLNLIYGDMTDQTSIMNTFNIIEKNRILYTSYTRASRKLYVLRRF